MPTIPVVLQTLNAPPVDYMESNFQQVSFRPEDQDAVRHLQIDGASEAAFKRSILGYTVYDEDNAFLLRHPPEPHPRYPHMVARTAEFVRELGEPTSNGPGNCLEFGSIEEAVTYQATPGINWFRDDQLPDTIDQHFEGWRYVRWVEEFDIENRIIPKHRLVFQGVTLAGGEKEYVPDPGAQLVPSSTIVITWHQIPAQYDEFGVPKLPGKLPTNIANCQGRVNSAYLGPYPPLTLYCAAPKRELLTMADGNEAWNITYHLLRRGDSQYAGEENNETLGPNWERLLRGNGMYRRVYRFIDADPTNKTNSIYNKADFNYLFRFDAPGSMLVIG